MGHSGKIDLARATGFAIKLLEAKLCSLQDMQNVNAVGSLLLATDGGSQEVTKMITNIRGEAKQTSHILSIMRYGCRHIRVRRACSPKCSDTLSLQLTSKESAVRIQSTESPSFASPCMSGYVHRNNCEYSCLYCMVVVPPKGWWRESKLCRSNLKANEIWFALCACQFMQSSIGTCEWPAVNV